jgi:ankyrin repeat protein
MPMHFAAYKNSVETIKVLLSKGASMEAKDRVSSNSNIENYILNTF